ncbi:hypothetical protein [Gilvibacter sediminis]|uniref:hypothetical protein n=1 Tax=Gilvibacter sediminis TaxID=379071 RepID=UPI002350CA23|nr:hypothetical protein [Gilvibacter sediminis]MDC7997316.1 hypothetical protein [Gilvibacter sediminis]
MKNTKFYPSIWQTFPNSLDLAAHWESQAKRTLNLSLTQNEADSLKVAEMSLNINGFALVDTNGKTTNIESFTQQTCLKLKGQQTGLYIKTREAVSLPEAEYTKVRFYLKAWDNSFILNDYTKKEVFDTPYLDFDIVGGYRVRQTHPAELRFQFSFSAYSFLGITRWLKHRILGKVKPKMAYRFAH